VKTGGGSPGDKARPDSAHAEPKKSDTSSPEGADTGNSERQFPDKSDAAGKYKTAPSSYRFRRARTPGIIEVLNENSYVMAEYSERTGYVKWQRMVLVSQRVQIEKWLVDHYPSA